MDDNQDKEQLAGEAYAGAERLNTRLHIQDHYGTSATPWFRWVFDHFRLWPDIRILDVGSGPGHVWWRNVQQLPADVHLFLADLSPGMVEIARDNLAGAEVAASFLTGDCERLPFAAASIDAVVALGVLDHLPDIVQGLAEVWRVLRPGGTFYVSSGGHTHLQEIEEMVSPFLPEVTYGGTSEQFGLENAPSRLSTHFTSVQPYDFRDTLCFYEVEPIVAYVRSEGQVAEKLNGPTLAAFRAAVEEQLAAQGEIRVTRAKGLFVAHKGTES